MKSIYQNIKKNYIYTFISATSFQEAIWMLFLAYRGMSLIQIGILESLFHVTGILCEVPTGYIADRFGRRTSRILSRAAAFVSCILMLSAHDFWVFALSFVLVALSYNLESGAGDALIYDSLIECGKKEAFMKIQGRQEISRQSARLLSLVFGGILATVSYELAYLLTTIIHLTAFIMAFSFVEPTVNRMEKKQSLLLHMKESLKCIWESRTVLKYIFYLEGFSLLYTTQYFYFQNFLKSKGFFEYQIGLMLAISTVMGIITASLAYKIERRLGRNRIVIIASTLSVVLFGIIAFTSFEPYAMIGLTGLEGFLFVIFSDYINKQIPSSNRATILSFQAMFFSILMVGFFPLIGAIAEASGFKTAFSVIAIIAITISVISAPLLLMQGKSRRNKIGIWYLIDSSIKEDNNRVRMEAEIRD